MSSSWVCTLGSCGMIYNLDCFDCVGVAKWLTSWIENRKSSGSNPRRSGTFFKLLYRFFSALLITFDGVTSLYYILFLLTLFINRVYLNWVKYANFLKKNGGRGRSV